MQHGHREGGTGEGAARLSTTEPPAPALSGGRSAPSPRQAGAPDRKLSEGRTNDACFVRCVLLQLQSISLNTLAESDTC